MTKIKPRPPPVYTDENVRKSILAKKLCAICGCYFSKHRGDVCIGQYDCFCGGFERKPGDTL